LVGEIGMAQHPERRRHAGARLTVGPEAALMPHWANSDRVEADVGDSGHDLTVRADHERPEDGIALSIVGDERRATDRASRCDGLAAPCPKCRERARTLPTPVTTVRQPRLRFAATPGRPEGDMKIGEIEILPVIDGTAHAKPTLAFAGTSDDDWAPHRSLLDE